MMAADNPGGSSRNCSDGASRGIRMRDCRPLHPTDVLDIVGVPVGIDCRVRNKDGEAMNGSQFLFSVERGDGIAIRGKSRLPARAAQLGIVHTFVGPPAFAVKVGLSLAWQRAVKVIGEPRANL
jgi:hypothetical protein